MPRLAVGRPIAYEPVAPRRFRDRAHAGDALALALASRVTARDVVVLGLAHGGMPVAHRVAESLGAPLDLLVVRRIDVPGIDGVPLGAIAEGSRGVTLDDAAWYVGVPSHVVRRLAAGARAELERCASRLRDGAPPPDVRGRTVILVDEGLTSATRLRAAVQALRARGPHRIVVAVPVACRTAADALRGDVDEVVAMHLAPDGWATATYYEELDSVRDEEIRCLLGRHTRVAIGAPWHVRSDVLRDVSERIAPCDSRPRPERRIEIGVEAGRVVGDLGEPQRGDWSELTPPAPRGFVVLASGSDRTRADYRDRYLAARLRLAGYRTLRVDLLTHRERDGCTTPLDAPSIASRLTDVLRWAARTGIDAAGTIVVATGNAAELALLAAAGRPEQVRAVIAWDGKLDDDAAPSTLDAPVLCLVGDGAPATLAAGRRFVSRRPTRARLIRVRGQRGAIDAPGSLGAAAEHVVRWLDALPP